MASFLDGLLGLGSAGQGFIQGTQAGQQNQLGALKTLSALQELQNVETPRELHPVEAAIFSQALGQPVETVTEMFSGGANLPSLTGTREKAIRSQLFGELGLQKAETELARLKKRRDMFANPVTGFFGRENKQTAKWRKDAWAEADADFKRKEKELDHLRIIFAGRSVSGAGGQGNELLERLTEIISGPKEEK